MGESSDWRQVSLRRPMKGLLTPIGVVSGQNGRFRSPPEGHYSYVHQDVQNSRKSRIPSTRILLGRAAQYGNYLELDGNERIGEGGRMPAGNDSGGRGEEVVVEILPVGSQAVEVTSFDSWRAPPVPVLVFTEMGRAVAAGGGYVSSCFPASPVLLPRRHAMCLKSIWTPQRAPLELHWLADCTGTAEINARAFNGSPSTDLTRGPHQPLPHRIAPHRVGYLDCLL